MNSFSHLVFFSSLLVGSFSFTHQQQKLLNPQTPVIPIDRVDLSEIAVPATNKYESALNETKILRFDDLEQLDPIGNISFYQTTHFSGFQLINVTAAWRDGLITVKDVDCATSTPNALFGRRLPDSSWPRFSLPCPDSLDTSSDCSPLGSSHPNPPPFDLISLTIKPLGPIAAQTVISFNLWNVTHGVAEGAHEGFIMYGNGGYQGSMRLLFRWFGGEWAKGFNVFEIYGRGTKGEDVGFCLDDLEVVRL